jgi:hypothetical protein
MGAIPTGVTIHSPTTLGDIGKLLSILAFT